MIDEELVADSVELIGRYAWTNVATDLRQGVCCDSSGDPHCLDGLGRLDVRALERRRRRTVDVFRAGDRWWYQTSGGKVTGNERIANGRIHAKDSRRALD